MNTENEVKTVKKKLGRPRDKYFIGEGVTVQPSEKYVKFGTLILHKSALNRDNKLVVKYPSMGYLREFPSQIISNDMASLLRDIIDGKIVNHKVLNSLSEREKVLFYNLCKRTRLDEQLGLLNYKEDHINKELERFELVRGMVLAGNNSPEILKELRTLILKFMSTGIMTKPQGNQLLLEINSIL